MDSGRVGGSITVSAAAALRASGRSARRSRQVVDQAAAVALLLDDRARRNAA